jgi:hypothetical protein
MALVSGYGGTVTFSGQTTVKCKSLTMNWERDSLDVTTVTDFQMKRLPGRFRRSGSMTLFRQDGVIDDAIRTHIQPTSFAESATAVLTFKYVDSGNINYDIVGAATTAMNIQITSATFTDDGTGVGLWDLTWEEQG